MQGLPAKRPDRLCTPVSNALFRALTTPSIERVTKQRVTHMGHVDPNLMGASGLKSAIENRGQGRCHVANAFNHVIVGASVSAALFDESHLLAISLGAANIAFNTARDFGHIAPDKGIIGAIN